MNDVHGAYCNPPLTFFALVPVNIADCTEMRILAKTQFEMSANHSFCRIGPKERDMDIIGRMHGLAHAAAGSLNQGDNAVASSGIFKTRSFEAGGAGEALRHGGVVIIIGRTKIPCNQILDRHPVLKYPNALLKRRHVPTLPFPYFSRMIAAMESVNT